MSKASNAISIAHLFGLDQVRPVRRFSGPAPTPRRKAGLDFTHLQPAPAGRVPSAAPASIKSTLAERIIAAGEKARTVAGTAARAPSGLAAEILAAGRKRREPA
jgi:hypothetical protein